MPLEPTSILNKNKVARDNKKTFQSRYRVYFSPSLIGSKPEFLRYEDHHLFHENISFKDKQGFFSKEKVIAFPNKS